MAASQAKTDEAFAKSTEGYTLVTVRDAAKLLKTASSFSLDLETTALDPRDGVVRLTQMRNDNFHIVIDHTIGGTFEQLIPHLRGKQIWVYNAKFEMRWCDYYCEDWHYDELLEICDVDFLAKAYIGGYPSSLAVMCSRDLGILLKKDEQRSDWSSKYLTKSQFDYAAFDAYVTWELFKHWDAKLSDEQFEAAMFVFNDAVRGTTEAERTGLELDTAYHERTVRLWKTKRDTYLKYLRKHTPEDVIPNLNSNLQIGKFLAGVLDKEALAIWPRTDKKKQLQFEGPYLRSISRQYSYPFNRWLTALAGLKYYNKYLSTYGDNLLKTQALAGKITSRFNIGQAKTGRYSSSSHNLQNIPRRTVVRLAFCTLDPSKRIMTLADYKGIEIRVLAEISGDEQLKHDAIYSDVHAASAAAIYGHELDYVLEVLASKGEGRYANIYPLIKEQRTKAKGFTFQLLYGAGPGALSDVLRCTFDEAVLAVEAWSARYPKAYGYRNVIFEHMIANDGFLPVHDGRTIRVFRDDQTLPVAANYGVQGAAASVMYRCMYRVQRLFSINDIPAYLAATVHDELLCYAEPEYADRAMELQVQGMTEAWLDIFPGTNTDNMVDYAIGTTWAAKP
jgi:DNA polymerase I-like protein with 3'-5' exonuclease and polymerase domains